MIIRLLTCPVWAIHTVIESKSGPRKTMMCIFFYHFGGKSLWELKYFFDLLLFILSPLKWKPITGCGRYLLTWVPMISPPV